MIKLYKDYIRCLIEHAPRRKNVSAWKNGVKNYAIALIDKLPDDYCMIFNNQRELEEHLKILKKLLLNGAKNWRQYSYGGRAYISNNVIALHLSTFSDYQKSKGGEKQPNRGETWLDVQAQALCQAELLIKSAIRDSVYQYFNKQ